MHREDAIKLQKKLHLSKSMTVGESASCEGRERLSRGTVAVLTDARVSQRVRWL